MSPRDLGFRLQDIAERVLRVQRAQLLLRSAEEQNSPELFEVSFDAILYGLIVIGEAVRSLPSDFLEQHPQIPWSKIIGIRNLLSHEYFRVDGALVRATLDEPLVQLFEFCQRNGDQLIY